MPFSKKARIKILQNCFVLRRGGASGSLSLLAFSFLGVFLVLFFRFVFRSFVPGFFRVWWRVLLLAPSVVLGVCFGLPFSVWCPLAVFVFGPVAVVGLFAAVCAVVRSAVFRRFRRPSWVPSGWLRVPSSSAWFGCRRWCRFRWLCVPASSVPGWLALVGSASVVPAVVRRRSGVLLFAWVLVPCVPVGSGWSPLFAPVGAGGGENPPLYSEKGEKIK